MSKNKSKDMEDKKVEEKKPLKMAIGIKGEGDTAIFLENSKSKSPAIQVSAKPAKREERTHPATLVNRNYHPITLSYMGKSMRLSPRERSEPVADYRKLGAIPARVTLIKSKK